MMSEVSDCKQSADSAAATRKRCASPSSPDRDQDSGTVPPRKATKVDHTTSSEKPSNSQSEYKTGDEDDGNNNTARRGTLQAENGEGAEPSAAVTPGRGSGTNNVTDSSAATTTTTTTNNNNNNSARAGGPDASSTGKAQSSDLRGSVDAKKVDTAKGTRAAECHPSTSSVDQSDSAAIAAAEALASLTRGDGEDSRETPCSSGRAGQQTRVSSKSRHGRDPLRESSRTQAAAADSSTSAQRGVDRGEGAVGTPDAEEGDDSLPGSSTSTPSSSFPSDDDDNDDGECAIVSVKMAPEVRQSVALLAQVQMRLEALEKKSARLHQRLEVKMSRQRRPHLDQRSSITQSIPGFWVTALLNHPHLSAHIDETDEDALSYMIDLEIESFKNSKLGYRIVFHFRRNPYFQNNMIMKELHLGMGGSPVSFSNAILWLRGQNLTAHSEPRKTSRGVYQTFFSWFGDHSGPSRDDIAQILKDDLYRDPLRYYLTPLWEPRENGSSSTSGARAADNSNGDECVVISDSDEEEDQEQDEVGQGHSREEDEDEEEEQGGPGAGSDDSDLAAREEEEEDEEEEEESFGEKEEESDVEELDDSSRGQKAGERDDEEDVEVDEEENESKD